MGVVKARSINEIRHACAAMVAHWAGAEGYERGEAQEFVRDLMACFGINKSRVVAYEQRATRLGGKGFIDAFLPGVALVEMKSAGKDLVAAEAQALQYVENLAEAELPRWVITSDFTRFRVLDLHGEPGMNLDEFAFADLPVNAEKLAFLAGYQVRIFGARQQEQASIQAARLMASLYEELEDSYDDHQASVFLVRTLFCLYADDAGVWDRDTFLEFLETRTAPDGSDLGAQLVSLFQVLATEKRSNRMDEMLARFPYVNGGVFDDPLPTPYFDRSMRDKLIVACGFNWSAISPAIFGSLFQSVKSKAARRELGEHYTTETNILKTINPLFLDDLRARFASARTLRELRELHNEIGRLRFLDPACGCGNFLVIAYRELRALETEILERLKGSSRDEYALELFADRLSKVRLTHFYGIEIEEWPARIAAMALHLVDHQANQAMELKLGLGPDPLPLTDEAAIFIGNALQEDWKAILPPSPDVVIMGNPPFIGQYLKTAEQTADLKLVWGKQYDGYLDYVTGWYKKAIDYFDVWPGRFAFVSTNSIAQGQPVPALFGPILAAGWRIRFAHQTFAWDSEASGKAAVHCVIVGFDKHRMRERERERGISYCDTVRLPGYQGRTDRNPSAEYQRLSHRWAKCPSRQANATVERRTRTSRSRVTTN